MKSYQKKLKTGVLSGIKKGWAGFLWMLKILIPISFFTVLFKESGWISQIDFLLKPAMELLSLPPAAAIPLIVGMLTGIYGGIASMIMLPFSKEQMTLIAIFLLISHNLIQEGTVQGKSGIHPLKATVFRLTASVITVIISAQFLVPEISAPVIRSSTVAISLPLMAVLKNWGIETVYLCIKIFLIIMGLMMLLETMKVFRLIQYVVRILTPVLKIMGLDQRVGILWLTATVFGIAYGAAVILEEAKEGNLTKEELERLHISIGINHSMVEDPSLFLFLGLNPFWLWLPRIITAIIAVDLFNLWQKKGASLLHIFDKAITADRKSL